MKSCYNCKSDKKELIHKGTRDNAGVDVFKCKNCGLMFLSSDSHIDSKFYANGEMVKNVNLEKWIENTMPDDSRRFNNLRSLINDKVLIDFGCGNASFLNLAKNVCKKVYGVELQKDFCEYFKKCGLDVVSSIEDLPQKSDVITMFHVLEHLKEPVESIKNITKSLTVGGKIIIEVPNSDDVLIKLYKSKSFADFVFWSCHLYVYNERVLRKIISDAGLKTISFRYIQRYSLMNHLYWLIKGKPGGHKYWAQWDYKWINRVYASILKKMGMTDTIEIVAEKF